MSIPTSTPATSEPQYYAPPARHTNGLAIVSLVSSLIGFSLVAVIFGHLALRQLRTRDEAGETAALIGLVLGYLGLAATVVAIVLMTASAAFPNA